MNYAPVNGLIAVTGFEGAKAYQLPPNSKVPLFDQNEDIIYLKTTDSAGYPTIKAFKFEPVEVSQVNSQDINSASDYVTREEFEKLASELDSLKSTGRSKAGTNGK